MFINDDRRKILTHSAGIVQSIHFIALLVDLKYILHEGSPLLLAPAPEMGWSSIQFMALVIMGSIDMLLILGFAAYFWMTYRKHAYTRRMGVAVLSGFQVTALAYCFVILPSQAMVAHPFNYTVISLAFIPVFLLWASLLRDEIQNTL